MPTKKIDVKLKISGKRFYNEENSFGIYTAVILDILDKEENPIVEYSNGSQDKISIKGTTGLLPTNEEYVATLIHEENDTYKGNYKVLNIYQELPKDIETQKLYFKALLTPNQFSSLMESYDGCDLIELFKSNQIDVNKVHGLGEKRYQQIREKILSSMDLAEVITFSEKYSIPLEIMKKYALTLGNPTLAVQRISKNPYLLIEMEGIGFLKADKIGNKLGINEESPFRIRACISHVIGESNNDGHTWIGEKEMLSALSSNLGIKKSIIVKELNNAVEDKDSKITVLDNRYTNEDSLFAEAVIAKQLKGLMNKNETFIKEEVWERLVDQYCKKHGYSLHENQRGFLLNWNKNRLNLLIGYGGSGKTFIQNVLIGILEENNLYTNFALLAPTGRASKVIAGYTNKTASTIHRRIPNFENELGIDENFVIVDESSMCDIFLSATLLTIISNPKVRVLFVGDDFQIPSVGIGNFLYDMIHSNAIPITKLTQVFRQEDGGIKDISYKIRNNERFLLTGDEGRKKFGKDCVFWLADSKYLLNGILKNYENVLKKYKQEDTLIISPTNKGTLGTVNINNKVQDLVNPKSESKNEFTVNRGEFKVTFREGDVVLNTTNSYGLETSNKIKLDANLDIGIDAEGDIGAEMNAVVDVFNGDIGKILKIDENSRKMIIDFDGYEVEFKADMINQLMHGWCITIHKSQGSQAKAVLVVLDKSATFQLNANLVYTGISRASEILLVLGQEKVINNSLRKFQNMERRSFLKEFLQELDSNEFLVKDEYYSKKVVLDEIYNLKNEEVKQEVVLEEKKENKWLYY